jgi:hypothetical protein
MKREEADVGSKWSKPEGASSERYRVFRRRLVDLRCDFKLHDADVISKRIAEADIYAVRLLDRFLGELDALGAQHLIRFSAVIRREPDRETGCTLRDELSDLPGGGIVHRRWARLLERMSRPGCPGTRTVSQRMNPRSWSLLTSRPSLPT